MGIGGGVWGQNEIYLDSKSPSCEFSGTFYGIESILKSVAEPERSLRFASENVSNTHE